MEQISCPWIRERLLNYLYFMTIFGLSRDRFFNQLQQIFVFALQLWMPRQGRELEDPKILKATTLSS